MTTRQENNPRQESQEANSRGQTVLVPRHTNRIQSQEKKGLLTPCLEGYSPEPILYLRTSHLILRRTASHPIAATTYCPNHNPPTFSSIATTIFYSLGFPFWTHPLAKWEYDIILPQTLLTTSTLSDSL